jgi:hypothetical protein
MRVQQGFSETRLSLGWRVSTRARGIVRDDPCLPLDLDPDLVYPLRRNASNANGEITMKEVLAVLLAAFVGSIAIESALQGDEIKKVPGYDSPVVKSILAPETRLDGRWIGMIRRGYEEHTLLIATDPDEKGAYRLKFYSWTDTGGVIKANRTGKFLDGVISLNEPVKGFGISKSAFSDLYAVRADGKDYLLPSANADELKTVEDLKPRIAYQFQRRGDR